MSSLRIESLRLVWLETFLTVTDAENISAAARELGVDQSTVSRYMIALRDWVGEDLLKLEPVKDDETGRMIRMTDAGIKLLGVVGQFVPQLTALRTEAARRKELLDSMGYMVGTMMADLMGKKPSQTVLDVKDHIKVQECVLTAMRDEAAPLDEIADYANRLRRFFAGYEDQLKRERKAARAKSRARSAAHIDMSAYRKPKSEA